MRSYLALALLLVLGGCAEESKPPAKTAEGNPERGRQVYLAQCAACHAADPAIAGPVGPPIKGSSRALLEAKLLRGEYPQGYTPKRSTALMLKQPQLEPEIPDLAAFLK